MLETVVNPSYRGVTLVELAPCLEEVTAEVIEVRWTDSKAEYAILERYPERNFRLYVRDTQMMERVATVLGTPVELDKQTIDAAKEAIIGTKTYDWRNFTTEHGQAVARGALIKVAANSIRAGKRTKIAKVAADCVLDELNPTDADVLLRLRILRGY